MFLFSRRLSELKDTGVLKQTFFFFFFHFSGDLVVEIPPANAGDMGLVSGPGRCPGGENGSSLQYSCLGNPKDREAWQESMGLQKSQT